MNKIDIDSELEKLKKTNRKASIPLLFASMPFELYFSKNELEENKEEIDEMFAQCEVMKVLDTYQKGETESLQEKYSENVIYAINEKKTELLKQIKSFENRKYCRYFYKVEAVDKLLKPTLEYLLKKKDDLEKSLNIMKREIKKQKNLQ